MSTGWKSAAAMRANTPCLAAASSGIGKDLSISMGETDSITKSFKLKFRIRPELETRNLKLETVFYDDPTCEPCQATTCHLPSRRTYTLVNRQSSSNFVLWASRILTSWPVTTAEFP